MAAPTSFVVAEQTAPNRAIVLRNRSLPHYPATWGGDNRVAIKYFPGNPVATAQVIGPTYTPSVFKGRWSDAFLYQGPAPQSLALRTLGFQGGGSESAGILRNFPALAASAAPPALSGQVISGGSTFISGGGIPGSSGLAQRARVLRDAFDLLRRSGQLLKVQWGSLVRFGFLTRTAWEHDREEDIRWEMEFAWIGDTAAPPRIVPPSRFSPLSLLRLLQSLLDAITGLLSLYAFVAQTYFQRVLSRIASLGSSVVAFLETLRKFTSFALLPAQALGSIRQQLTRIKLAARDLLSSLRNIPAAYGAQKRGSQIDADSCTDFAAAIIFAVTKLGGAVSDAYQQIAGLENSDVLGVHVMVEGTTLRDVATQFYGTPDGWPRIAEYNSLPGSLAPTGAVLRIPKPQPGSAG